MPPPTLRRRRLAAELRRLRAANRRTLDEVSIDVDLAKSTLSRIETGQIGARPVVVRALLAAYRVDGEQAEALLRLAREAGQRGWWHGYRDVLTDRYADYIALESEATAIREYEPQLVPGLLQTEAYAREIVGATALWATGDDVARLVAVRMRRQDRLAADPPLTLEAIVDEAALRRRIGPPGVMLDQIDRIRALAGRLNVTFRVLPSGVGAHPGMSGGFAVVTLPDPTGYDVVYVEGANGEQLTEDAATARRCDLVLDRLRALALDPAESLALLADIHAGLVAPDGAAPAPSTGTSTAPEPSTGTSTAPEPPSTTSTAPEPPSTTSTAPEPPSTTSTAPEPSTGTPAAGTAGTPAAKLTVAPAYAARIKVVENT